MGQATLNVDGFARFENSLSIGSNQEDVELEINNTDNDSDMLLDFNTETSRFITGLNISSGNFYGTVSNDRYSFITNSIVRMILSKEGNLGIGTPGPQQKLHVREDGNAGEITTVVVLESSISDIPKIKFDVGSDVGMSIQYDGSSLSDRKLQFMNTTDNDMMTVTNDGKMGVNEDNPVEALHVNGSIVIDVDNNVNEINYRQNNSKKASLNYNGQNLYMTNIGAFGSTRLTGETDAEIQGSGDIIIDGKTEIVFKSGGNSRAIIDSEGLFGIRKLTPDGMFHVKASGVGKAFQIETDLNNNDWGFTTSDDNLELSFNSPVVATYHGPSGNFSTTSDRRLKENINSLEDGVLADINKLEPTSYHYIEDKKLKQKSIGFIAQDMLKVFPEVVNSLGSEDDYYALNYSILSVLTVKALQEQQAEIDILKKEIEEKLILKETLKRNKALAIKLEEKIASINNNLTRE